jgi:hypothetical protein
MSSVLYLKNLEIKINLNVIFKGHQYPFPPSHQTVSQGRIRRWVARIEFKKLLLKISIPIKKKKLL